MINQYTIDKLDEKFKKLDLDFDSKTFIYTEISAMQDVLHDRNPAGFSVDSLHTQAQVGYMCGLMDLERDDRLELLEMLIGFELYYDESIDSFPGKVCVDAPDRSSKDLRISKYMTSVLIEYFLTDQNAKRLKDLLGYRSASATAKARSSQNRSIRKARSVLTQLTRTIQTAQRIAKRQQRKSMRRVPTTNVSN